VRFISLEIFTTGVLAFECFLRSRKSAAVHSRRAGFFVALVFILLNSVVTGTELLATARHRGNYLRSIFELVINLASKYLQGWSHKLRVIE